MALQANDFSIQPGTEALALIDDSDSLSNWLEDRSEAQQDSILSAIEGTSVLVFEGNATISEDIRVRSFVAAQERGEAGKFATAVLEEARVLIFNGNLSCKRISTDCFEAIFILGNLDCTLLELRSGFLYVRGNLSASAAVFASAEDSEVGAHRDQWGEDRSLVDGVIASPLVKSWYYGLSHLKFSQDSGQEIAFDLADPDAACEGFFVLPQ